MTEVGLSECWSQQRAVKAEEMGLEARVVTKLSIISGVEETTVYPPHRTEWRTVVRKATHGHEQREWLAAMERKPKLQLYRQWKTTLRREEYLSSPDVVGRMMLFRLRSGTNDLRVDTGRNERKRDEVTGRRRRLERKERVCRQCGLGVEDEIHAMLYCPRYVEIRRDLMRELAREQKEDLGLQSFLTGLSEASMVMQDREEAEKTMALMMGEEWIMQTMELAKQIMRRRNSIIRERQGVGSVRAVPVTAPIIGRPRTNPVRSRRNRSRCETKDDVAGS